MNGILSLLGEFGPMTRAEICAHLGATKSEVSAVVTRMANDTPRKGKRIYVERYVNDCEGARSYPRAVYALGNKPDAKRPKADRLAPKRRYNAKQKAMNTMNFVFNLALPRRAYEKRQETQTA